VDSLWPTSAFAKVSGGYHRDDAAATNQTKRNARLILVLWGSWAAAINVHDDRLGHAKICKCVGFLSQS